jgi:outer membrane protein assembly factor BamB
MAAARTGRCRRPALLEVAFWLAALDIRDGHLLRTAKIGGSVQRHDGSTLTFAAKNHYNASGLLLSNGSLYLAFGMRFKEEWIEYHGWVMRYDAAGFSPRGVFCTTPESIGASQNAAGNGGGIWEGGGGLVADSDGNVYFQSGNAWSDPTNSWYGDAIIKLSPAGNRLVYAESFSPKDPQKKLKINDVDLGSAGSMLIPGIDRVVGGGKTGTVYLVERAAMTEIQEFQGFTNFKTCYPNVGIDDTWDKGPHLHGSPTWWQGPDPAFSFVYLWAEKDFLKAFKYDWSTGKFDTAHPLVGSVVALCDTMPGGMISLSANGSTSGSGILWATLPRANDHVGSYGQHSGWLMAFDAETLALLWKTEIPSMPRWAPPTIADGKVFVATSSNQLLLYQLNFRRFRQPPVLPPPATPPVTDMAPMTHGMPPAADAH